MKRSPTKYPVALRLPLKPLMVVMYSRLRRERPHLSGKSITEFPLRYEQLESEKSQRRMFKRVTKRKQRDL